MSTLQERLQPLQDEAGQALLLNNELRHLKSNNSFNKVIMVEYMQNHAVQLVKSLAGAKTSDEESVIMDQIRSISTLNAWLQSVEVAADQAVHTIRECEVALAEDNQDIDEGDL